MGASLWADGVSYSLRLVSGFLPTLDSSQYHPLLNKRENTLVNWADLFIKLFGGRDYAHRITYLQVPSTQASTMANISHLLLHYSASFGQEGGSVKKSQTCYCNHGYFYKCPHIHRSKHNTSFSHLRKLKMILSCNIQHTKIRQRESSMSSTGISQSGNYIFQ